ncbi:GNAT family N-acetyltransferase [Azotobacter armeniacus]
MSYSTNNKPFTWRLLEVDIRRINWQETIHLRHKVLWPKESPEFCHIEGDENAWHFGAFISERLVSVASVYPDGNIARLRKFATDRPYQEKGIGTALLNAYFG